MNGPENWSKLSESYLACELGKAQSPVSINKAIGTVELRPLTPEYSRVNVDLFSDGNNLHARFSPGDALNFEETRYYLREMIVHLPGEHRIPAVVPDVEIQLVHESEDGKKLMLAVMVQEGSSHTEWAHINEALPLAPSGVNKVMGFWVERLLPRRRGYYQYTGSETIPPCTEGVQWLVMDESISFSGSQIDKLSRLFPKSARPLQASNARRVLHSR